VLVFVGAFLAVVVFSRLSRRPARGGGSVLAPLGGEVGLGAEDRGQR
jgi:hypothetical protein